MPAETEWTALLTNFDWAWDDTNKGLTVTIKGGTPWTDPTIFLPAAGERNAIYPLNFPGEIGYYWSSSLCLSSSDWAEYAHLTLKESGASAEIKSFSRILGMSVRPVTE